METSGRIAFNDAQNSGGIKVCALRVSSETAPAQPKFGFQRPKGHWEYTLALYA